MDCCCSKKREPFIYTIIHCIISMAFFLLFLSSPLWIPKSLSSFKHVCSILLSNMRGPNCMFLLCNIIIVFLFWESRWSRGRDSTKDIYEEYMEMKRKFQKREESALKPDQSIISQVVKDHTEEDDAGNKKGMATSCFDDCNREEDLDPVEAGEDLQQEELVSSFYKLKKDGIEEEEEEEEEGEEEDGLPTEELNKKFEEYIEKVKRKRRMEQKMLV